MLRTQEIELMVMRNFRLYSSSGIVRVNKLRKWAVFLAQYGETGNKYSIFVEKFYSKRVYWRLVFRWKDNIKMCLWKICFICKLD
jgi:hypothetical protein